MGEKNINPISKENNTSFQKLLFFQCFFGKTETSANKKKQDFDPGRQAALRQPGGDLVAWRSWIFFVENPRGGGPFFSGGREGRERREGAIPTQVLISTSLVGFLLFEVLCFFLVGTSEKKIILKLEKGPKKKNAIDFLHVEVLWQVFQGNLSVCDVCAVFLWWRKKKGRLYTSRIPQENRWDSWVNRLLFVH